MDPITLELIEGVRRNGPTDPINYYRRPLVGALFRKRINLGLQLLPPGRFTRGLEVGYGSGGLLLTLAKGVQELHGIDLDAEPEFARALLAERGCRATLVQGTVDALPYASGYFDVIICFSVFEHLAEYQRALREVHRVLVPDGLFLLGMPAVNRTMNWLFHAIGYTTINDIHVTTPRMIQEAFSTSGFRLAAYQSLDFPFSGLGMRLYHNWLLKKTSC